ncbi:MAG: transposase, partial [Chloroflexota bacterium]|nr:transposase [Chloroflexota bacterium]
MASPGPVRIVLEATGRYHRGVTAACAAAGLPPAVVNPSWTQAFARSEGRRAKTDRTDAHLLARSAQQKQPAPTPQPTATTRQLTDLASDRDDLVTMRTMEKNRVTVMDPLVQALIVAHIADLDARIAAVETAIAERIATDPFWAERVAILKTVPGLSHGLGPQ